MSREELLWNEFLEELETDAERAEESEVAAVEARLDDLAPDGQGDDSAEWAWGA